VDLRSGPITLERVPKPRGGHRFVARLSPSLEAEYRDAVLAIVPNVERALAAGVLSNRVAERSRSRGAPAFALAPWRPARRRFVHAARLGARGSGAVLVADVRDCYACISDEVVASTLRDLGVRTPAIERIGSFLDLTRRHDVRGLPVGPEPSAVLANAVLARADDALIRSAVPHLRWADDVIAFARDRSDASRALRALHAALEAIGLQLAPEKTAVLPGGGRALPAPSGIGISDAVPLGRPCAAL